MPRINALVDLRYSAFLMRSKGITRSLAPSLKPFFLAHPIYVRIDQPLQQILTKPKVSERLTKWAIKLGEYDLSYESRIAIKAQALADFLAELTPGSIANSDANQVTPRVWSLYIDGL